MEATLKKLDVHSVFAAIETSAKNKNKPEDRYIPALKAGEWCRQGDVYFISVEKNHAHGAKMQSKQVSQGNTRGSRHICEGETVTLFEGTMNPPKSNDVMFLGPMIEDLAHEIHVSHPEHADVHLRPGCYQVVHQMDAKTRQRVQD